MVLPLELQEALDVLWEQRFWIATFLFGFVARDIVPVRRICRVLRQKRYFIATFLLGFIARGTILRPCFNEPPDHLEKMFAPVDAGYAALPKTSGPKSSMGPFLIYCAEDKGEISPLYMFHEFHHFAFVESTPLSHFPPWNATAFLFLSERDDCKKNLYYRAALRRQKYSNPVKNRQPHNDSWVHGVYWPPEGKYQLKSISNRPATVALLGEVFWRYLFDYNDQADFSLYRATGEPHPPSRFIIHYIQGISHAYRLEANDYAVSKSGPKWTGKEKRQLYDSSNSKGFCVFLTSHTFAFYKDMDNLFRSAIFRILNEQYKECVRPPQHDCPGIDLDGFKCQQGYKFNINMDNTHIDGYISEKIFAGHLSGGVPIYFGAPDVEEYLNPKAFIHCAIDHDLVEQFRDYLVGNEGFRSKRVFSNATGFWPHVTMQDLPSDETLITFAASWWRPHVEKCIERVMSLDEDNVAYQKMLEEPLLLNPEELKGKRILRGVELVYDYLSGKS